MANVVPEPQCASTMRKGTTASGVSQPGDVSQCVSYGEFVVPVFIKLKRNNRFTYLVK